MKKYPENTKFSDYYLVKEGTAFAIRRMVNLPNGEEKQERLPKNQWKHLKSKEELSKYIIRLNGRESNRVLKSIDVKLAHLPPSVLEDFREVLFAEIPNLKDAKVTYKNLHRYFITFFTDHLNLRDPLDWKLEEIKWGKALLSESKHSLFEDKQPRSAKTIKGIIHTANRFMMYLHKRYPKEIPAIKLTPVSKAKLKDYDATMNLDTESVGNFITDTDWKIIVKEAPSDLLPFIKLGYYFGLRRGEILGLNLNDVRLEYLSVERQLVSINKDKPSFKPLKGKTKRKTPYWFINPDETHKLIKQLKLIHPDTLGVKFIEFMQSLEMNYQLHDLRRTFITKALRKAHHTDVQLAVGHTHINTTMKYQRDDRVLADNIYRPS